MPSSLPPWPALAGVDPADSLTVHRAVLGKVHQAASDFRWITRTDAVDPRRLGLDQRLSLGPEDRPLRAAAWRSLADACVAIVVYRSRAVDRAGRSGGLEKQVLYWSNPAPGATAAGAFGLLHALADASDALWWDQWQDFRWDDSEFFLPREPENLPLRSLDLLVEQGLTELREAVSQQQLAAFYAELLAAAPHAPARLDAIAEPLTPLALAALLLPFDPKDARRLSIAGALPNSRQQPSALQNWDGVVRTAEQPELPDDRPQPNARQLERGAEFAAAVWRGAPEELRPRRAAAPAPPPPPAPAPPQPDPPKRQAPQQPVELSASARRFEQLLLAGPAERYLEPAAENVELQAEPAARLLLAQARKAMDELTPETLGKEPRARQLALKVEMIRAWICSCCPYPEIAGNVSAESNARVPPLYYAASVEPEVWAAACTLAPQRLRTLCRRSSELESGWTRELRDRYRQWLRHPAVELLLRGD